MERLADIKVGDILSYSANPFFINERDIGTVSKVTSTMVYINEDTIRFRRSDGKMIGKRCYAKKADATELKLYRDGRRTEHLRAQIRLFLHSSLPDLTLSELECLNVFINGIYEKRKEK